MAGKNDVEAASTSWETLKDADSRRIEDLFRQEGFGRVDSYRLNPVSLRIRVIDPRFEEMSVPDREDLVFAVIDKLPREIREDILLLVILAPSEIGKVNRHALINLEFENPLTIGR